MLCGTNNMKEKEFFYTISWYFLKKIYLTKNYLIVKTKLVPLKEIPGRSLELSARAPAIDSTSNKN